MKIGKVYIVGAGPSEPDLITLKGFKVLSQADVVIYDFLVDKEILKYAKPEAELICADTLDKERYSNGFLKRQDLINEIMVKKAKEGKNVVRLKNGDPSIFGRLNEELEYLVKNKIEFRIIPGVTAATAAACYNGIPLTARGVSAELCITTGHEAKYKSEGIVNFETIAKLKTIVLYMSIETLDDVVEKLIQHGKSKDTPVCVISNVSNINQKLVVGTLKNIKEKVKKNKITSPAVVIVGDVVKKEKKFNWFKKTKKVLFTGISKERFFENSILFHIPTIEIKPLDNYSKMDNFIKRIIASKHQKGYLSWIFFTSRFGVIYFFDRLFKLGYDTRDLTGIKIAAIGTSTANKLKEYGIVTDLIPKVESSLGLATEFKKIVKNNIGKKFKVFLFRSDIADKGLNKKLVDLGVEVECCIAYKNIPHNDLPQIDFSNIDEIIFTAPSVVRSFVNRYGREVLENHNFVLKAIGDVTKKELKKFTKRKVFLIS